MQRRLRAVALLAQHEISEAYHSRKLWLFGLFYLVAGSVGVLKAFDIFCDFEASLSTAIGASKGQCPGVLTDQFMHSKGMHGLLARWVNDPVLANDMQGRPPLALLVGWLLFSYLPFAVALTSADCVSSELSSGSNRYVLPRVERWVWSLGKLAGQTLLSFGGILFAALAAYVTGLIYAGTAHYVETGLWIVRMTLHSLPYAFAYVGLMVGLSHLTRSVPLSRVIAVAVVITEGILRRSAMADPAGASAFVGPILPYSTIPSLWRTEATIVLPALLLLTAFGAATFGICSAVRIRRDM